MSLAITNPYPRSYTVETNVFNGPMDLLLQLIQSAELDITSLALAQVTDPFLQHVRELKENAADEVSSFLVIAAKLLQIKSEALLPRPPEREPGEEDPGEELARQLIAYKRYKEIASDLKIRENLGFHTYLRLAAPPKVEGKLDLSGITLESLVETALRIFENDARKPPLRTVVNRPTVTIREKISRIVASIRELGHIRFSDVLGKVRTRIDVVVSFLAMLELVKRKRIAIDQPSMFGDIDIVIGDDWDEEVDFELEFGE